MPDDAPVAAPDRPQVRAATTSGTVTVTAEARPDVQFGPDATATSTSTAGGRRRDAIDVRPNDRLEIRCPTGSDVMVGTASGRVRLIGELGDVRVTSQSGKVSVEAAASVDVRTMSGAIRVESCRGVCRVTTTSGSVRIGAAAEAEVRSVSSKVELSATTARVRTVSGTISIDAAGDTSVETVSGRVTVSLPPGVHPRVAVAGMKRPRIQVPEGDDCTVRVRAVSSTVVVRST